MSDTAPLPATTSLPAITSLIEAPHRRAGREVAAELGVDPARGLDDAEATSRLASHGPNRLASAPRRSALRRFLDQFASPIVGVLAGAAVLAGAVGDLKDAVVIGAVLVLNAVLGFVQEGRAANALAALEQMLALSVTVRRNGRAVDVPADEVVPGDVVLLEAGDRVPADGRVVIASALAADESMLTGESVPADKRTDPLDVDQPALGDRANELFMNSTVVRGRAELLVTATGMQTEVGRIAGMLAEPVDSQTPLERQLHRLGTRLTAIVGVAIALVLTISLVRGRSLGEALLEAVALGVAAIPEGLPAVVTVTLAVGVSQMAQRNAIVRRLASVETLGSTTAICTDKTGTLTRNEMTPVAVWHAGEVQPVGDLPRAGMSLTAALEVATHVSDATLGERGAPNVGDPTEIALLLAARDAGIDTIGLRAAAPRLTELPFDSATKLMATVVDDGRDTPLLAVKGAPDVLVARCTATASPSGPTPLTDDDVAAVTAALASFGDQGQRVLAIASRRLTGDVPTGPEAVADDLHDLTLEALVAIVDPPRDGVAEAIELCRRAGIRVRMITGDHPDTARAIANQVGITGRVLTGRELDELSDEQLAAQLEDIGVLARVAPDHKVRIVDALQAAGEVVAMTGDGVNDAAALRRADVGVAMGIAGTEVTKEAADVVLADDDFTTIVAAVERGRTIYDNILTFVRFQLTTNLSAIGTILTAGLIGLPVPFTALQILFVNLIADGPPAMALGVDRPRRDVMQRPPRDPSTRILSARSLASMLPVAVAMAVGTLAVLATADAATQNTMAFTTFVLLQLANVLAVRGGDGPVLTRQLFTNRWVWLALGLVLAVQVAVVHVGAMQALFDTTALSARQWATAAGVALIPIVIAELRGRLRR